MTNGGIMTTFEVQYLDGFGDWRRWSHLATRESAESSARRCFDYVKPAVVRIRELRR